MNTPNDPMPDHAMNMDVLINRIVDGEASPSQRQQFEALATDDPALWRRLALRQQDVTMLAVHVEPTLNAAERIDLPREVPDESAPVIGVVGANAAGRHGLPARSSWWFAAAGWAALVALAAAWGFTEHLRNNRSEMLGADARNASLQQSPEEHLQQYMTSPYVLGEMSPTLLNIEDLPDGRFAVSYLRRIVEVTFADSPEQIPLDAEGNLTSSPHAVHHATTLPDRPPSAKD